jgi:cysteine synthase A
MSFSLGYEDASTFFVAVIMPDDVAEDKAKALLCLGAKVEKVRPASIVDKRQVRGRMLSWHHSYFIETVRGMSLPHRLLLAVHDEQNLAKQRAMEFGQTVLNDPEDDLLVSSQTQSTALINHRKGATSLDLELENKPRGFFADQFEVNYAYR